MAIVIGAGLALLVRARCAAAVALNGLRLGLAWAIGIPAVVLLCTAVVLCLVAIELLPKRA